jgi:TldD protein
MHFSDTTTGTHTRRGVLHGMAAGTTILTLPHFLAACGPKDLGVQAAADGTPANPFLSWFGIDEGVLRVVMAELTSRGADAADLYFQYSRTNSIALEDGIVSRASSRVDQGVGLRVVIGDQVGFAIT